MTFHLLQLALGSLVRDEATKEESRADCGRRASEQSLRDCCDCRKTESTNCISDSSTICWIITYGEAKRSPLPQVPTNSERMAYFFK